MSVLSFVLVTPLLAAGQSLEVGATIGNGQRGSEGALVRSEARLVTGVHVSAWWADRIETALRVVWLDLPDTGSAATYYVGCDLGQDGRCRPTGSVRVIRRAGDRRFTSGQALYHFRRGRRVGPFAGVGFGTIRDTEERWCETAGCELLVPGLESVLGPRTASSSDLFFPVAGIATRIAEHLVIRGGVQFHRPFGEELSLFESFIAIGYRF